MTIYTVRNATTAEPVAIISAESAEAAARQYAEGLRLEHWAATPRNPASFYGFLGARRYNFDVKEGQPGPHARAYWLGVNAARNGGFRRADDDKELCALFDGVNTEGLKKAWVNGYDYEKAKQAPVYD